MVTSAARSLEYLQLQFASLPIVEPSHLHYLQTVHVQGELDSSHLPSAPSGRSIGAFLVAIFEETHQLRVLLLEAQEGFISTTIDPFDEDRVLHYLPKSIETASFRNLGIDPSRAAVASLAPPTHDEAGDDEFEALCKRRGVVLGWHGGRTKKQEGETAAPTLSFETLRALAAALRGT
ncbi:hypothetical protein JCM10212_001128 [Sporobolomyces blumeae]